MTLTGVLPDLARAYQLLTDAASVDGITFTVAPFGGLRTAADTAKILHYREQDYHQAVLANPDTARIPIGQWRPIAPWGASYHNFGAAFDVKILRDGGLGQEGALRRLAEYGQDFGLRWGGTFPRTAHSGPDYPHFELAIPLTTAKAKWLAYTTEQGIPSGVPTETGAEAGPGRSGRVSSRVLVALVVLLGGLLVLWTLRR